MSYFEELGVRVLWLNPIYESPQKDNGYDISDFRAIDETFGGMEAMDKLIEEIHNLGEWSIYANIATALRVQMQMSVIYMGPFAS